MQGDKKILDVMMIFAISVHLMKSLMILTKLSKKRKFKNGMILRIYKIKKKCPERQTMTAVSQSDIHISVDRASKKMGIWKMMTLTYSSVYTNDCHSKQAQELHIFWRNFMD